MTMVLQGKAKLRRVGNSLCLPLPMRGLRAEHLEAGDEVDFIVSRPRRINPAAFGSAAKFFPKEKSIEEIIREARTPSDYD